MSFVVQNNYGVSSSGLRNKKKEAQNMSFFGNTKNFLTIMEFQAENPGRSQNARGMNAS